MVTADGGGEKYYARCEKLPKGEVAGLQNFPAQQSRQSHLSLKSFTSKLDKLLRMGHIPSFRNSMGHIPSFPVDKLISLNWEEKLTIV